MSDDRDKAERTLREARFDLYETFGGYEERWENKSRTTTVYVDLSTHQVNITAPLDDLPALLAPHLTDVERVALSWAETTAHLMAGRTITADSKQLAQRHANTLQALRARLGGGDVDAE